MRVCLLHLSDIHFRTNKNPVSERVEQIVRAVLSTDVAYQLCIILITGDIAFSGAETEYSEAASFLECLGISLSLAT